MSSNAAVSGCEKLTYSWSAGILHLMNLVTLIVGVVCFAYAVTIFNSLYPHDMNIRIAWIPWGLGIDGTLFVIESLFCFTAIVTTCRSIIIVPKFLVVLAAISSLALSITALAQKPSVYSYLDEGSDQTALTDKQTTDMKDWYVIVAYTLFSVGILCFVKLWFMMGFRTAAERLDDEFEALLTEDQTLWDDKMSINKVTREEKYNDLRAYYKQKYRVPSRDSGRS